MNSITDEKSPQNAEADLALIRQMMAAGRRRAGINGAHLVWWGGILAIGFFSTYAQIMQWMPPLGVAPWILLMVVGWSGSFYLGHKAGRANSEHNPALSAYSSAWLAVGITMLVHMVMSLIGHGTPPTAATMLSGGVIGCAFFVMACVLQIRPMFFAAAGWWAIMAYAIYIDVLPKGFLLVLSGASLLLIMLPGLYLRRLAENGK